MAHTKTLLSSHDAVLSSSAFAAFLSSLLVRHVLLSLFASAVVHPVPIRSRDVHNGRDDGVIEACELWHIGGTVSAVDSFVSNVM